MGMISRVEPVAKLIEDQEDYYPAFKKVGWLNFLCIFNGHNVQVTKAFTRTLNCERAKIGYIELQLDEEVIAKATKLPLKGECWSKTKRLKDIPLYEILVSLE